MECAKCKNKLKKDSIFCTNCGKKINTPEIKKDIGGEAITRLKKLLELIEAKNKEGNEKMYPCPFCNKGISVQSLKSKLNEEDGVNPKAH